MFSAANRMQLEGRFSSLRRDASVLLLANREYDRLEAASVLLSFPGDFLETPSGFSEYANPLTISEKSLGFDNPPQLEKSQWFGAFHAALSTSGHDFVLSDTDLSPERWSEHKVIVVTTLDYLDATIQQALVDHARNATVVIGPRVPRLDSQMQPCTILADAVAAGTSRIIVAGSPDEVAAAVQQACDQESVPTVAKNDPDLDVIVHVDETDQARRVVFVVNPTDKAIEASVSLGHDVATAVELWSAEPARIAADQISCSLSPYTIHVYDCHLS